MPYALSKSGYAGVAILLLLAVVTNYSGKALVRCANTVADRGEVEAGAMVRYEDIARTAFGNFGKTIIAAIMYTELVGTCALLLILESDSLWSVAGPTLKEQGASALGGLGSWIATQRGVFWLAMAIVVPTVCAPNVASLSFLGVCGFAATATVTATVATLLFSGVFTPLLCRVLLCAHAFRLYVAHNLLRTLPGTRVFVARASTPISLQQRSAHTQCTCCVAWTKSSAATTFVSLCRLVHSRGRHFDGQLGRHAVSVRHHGLLLFRPCGMPLF